MRERAANGAAHGVNTEVTWHDKARGDTPTGPGQQALGRASPARPHVAHGTVDQRAMERVEVRKQRSDLGQERIGENRGDFFFAAAARVANERAHFHLECVGEALQRSECGNGFAVLDFGDVGAGHLHAARQLALAQVTRTTNLAYLTRHLQTRFGTSRDGLGGHQLWG